MATNQLPDEVEPEGTPDSVPTKTPDAELRLTDEGIELPEFLKGYIGEFTIRTPSITGEMETSAGGLPETEFFDGVLATYPSSGDWHGDLEEGMLGISTTDHRETVYKVVDERENPEE